MGYILTTELIITMFTSPKCNLESENDGFQKESRDFFCRFHVKFQGSIHMLIFYKSLNKKTLPNAHLRLEAL